jgi:hypothetical protein
MDDDDGDGDDDDDDEDDEDDDEGNDLLDLPEDRILFTKRKTVSTKRNSFAYVSKSPKKCSVCREPGHTKKSCPFKNHSVMIKKKQHK